LSFSESAVSQKLEGFFLGRAGSRSGVTAGGDVRVTCSSRGRSFLRPNPANKSSSGSEDLSLLAFAAVLGGSIAAGGKSELEDTPNNLATVSHDDLNRDGGSGLTGGTGGGVVSSMPLDSDVSDTDFVEFGCDSGSNDTRPLSRSDFFGGAAFFEGGSMEGVPSRSAREFQWSDMDGVDADN
jgi:hypothetical protein